MKRSLVTWNIRHGGGAKDRREKVISTLIKFDADVLVISEFRDNVAGDDIKRALSSAGYALSHPAVPERNNSVLVASRFGIAEAHALRQSLADPRHLWVAKLPWITLCAVYMPLDQNKIPYWAALREASLDEAGPDVFVGDFNTGNNRLDLADGATRFVASDFFDEFGRGRLKDVWRSRHPEIREYFLV